MTQAVLEEIFIILMIIVFKYLLKLFINFRNTLSGRTGSVLVWHSEGRTIEALSVQ